MMVFMMDEEHVWATEEELIIELNDEKVANEYTVDYIWTTDDAPDNIKSIINQRNVRSLYEVIDYNDSYIAYAEVLGKTVKLLTINVYGSIYLYEDGKVHIYNIHVNVKEHVSCGSEAEIDRLLNTDGTFSMAEAHVTTNSLLYGNRYFICTVMVGGEGLVENPPSIEISFHEL